MDVTGIDVKRRRVVEVERGQWRGLRGASRVELTCADVSLGRRNSSNRQGSLMAGSEKEETVKGGGGKNRGG